MSVASELFIERGYEAVSLKDITDRAGLTKGAFYGHFRSKGQILVELIRWHLAEREHTAEFEYRVSHPSEAFELVGDIANRHIRLLQIDAAAAARHDPDVAAGMAEFYEERNRAIRSAVSAARHPDELAFVIASLSHGFGLAEAVGLPVPSGPGWADTLRSIVEAAMVADQDGPARAD